MNQSTPPKKVVKTSKNEEEIDDVIKQKYEVSIHFCPKGISIETFFI